VWNNILPDRQDEGMLMTEAQRRAKEAYRAKIIKRITIELYPGDEALLDHLEKQPAKQTYIKSLIHADMQKTQNKEKSR